MINAKGNLIGSINSKQELIGTLNKAVEYIDPVTQEKEITPSKEIQIIEPDRAFTGLSKVTVNPISDEYIIPSGEIKINANGNYNVTDKARAKVNVPIKTLGTKTITKNGVYNATDDNLDGYSQVEVETSGGVDINDYFNNTLTSKGNYVSSWEEIVKKIPPITIIGNDARYIFYGCRIDGFTQIDTSNVTNMYCMFSNARCKTIPELDASKVTDINSILSGCTKLENFGGLLNLGKAFPDASMSDTYALGLKNSNNLTHDSLMNAINKLYDISNKGTQIISLGDTNKAKLTTEEIAIATNKGWTVY